MLPTFVLDRWWICQANIEWPGELFPYQLIHDIVDEVVGVSYWLVA